MYDENQIISVNIEDLEQPLLETHEEFVSRQLEILHKKIDSVLKIVETQINSPQPYQNNTSEHFQQIVKDMFGGQQQQQQLPQMSSDNELKKIWNVLNMINEKMDKMQKEVSQINCILNRPTFPPPPYTTPQQQTPQTSQKVEHDLFGVNEQKQNNSQSGFGTPRSFNNTFGTPSPTASNKSFGGFGFGHSGSMFGHSAASAFPDPNTNKRSLFGNQGQV